MRRTSRTSAGHLDSIIELGSISRWARYGGVRPQRVFLSDGVKIFEHRSQPLVSRQEFVRRLGKQGAYAGLVVLLSVLLGMAGYHWIAGFTWVDSFVNACMLLGGMGPVGDLPDNPAKIFAGLFALYAGLVFLLVAVLLLTPVIHRVLHYFHWEGSRRDKA